MPLETPFTERGQGRGLVVRVLQQVAVKFVMFYSILCVKVDEKQ